MKKRSTSLISVLLTVFLVFSMLFMTFAQQNPKYEDERAAAKADAERDAANDVNKLIWGGVSCVAGAVGITGCLLGGLIVAFGAEYGDGWSDEEILITSLLTCGGGGIVAFSPVVLAGSMKPTPPSERLLGKSPEYVDTYVNTYVRKVRQHRRRASVNGLGYAAMGTGIVLVLNQVIP